MKILLVLDQYDDGNNGTTITAQRLADGLMKLGHRVSVVCAAINEDNSDYLKRYNLKPRQLPFFADEIVKKQGMTFAIPDKRILVEAIEQADIVHFVMPFKISRVGVKIAQDLRIPHTAAFHVQPENISYNVGMGKIEVVNKVLYYAMNKLFYSNFRHLHCPSNFIAQELKKNNYTAKLHVISNGITDTFSYHRCDKPDELKNRFVILMIGRLSNEKHQDLLIEAVTKSKYADSIQLIFAGHGPKLEEYKKLGAKLTHMPIIDFYTQEQLFNVIGYSDLYVHTADVEIEAISCIEAFASGLVPIIANSPLSATPQFALDERSLFPHGNAESLAKKIDYWIENKSERELMGKKYAESAKQFNHANCVQKMLNMFEEEIADYSLIASKAN